MPLLSRPLRIHRLPLDVVAEVCAYADFGSLLLSLGPASKDFRELVSSELVLRHKHLLEDFAQHAQAFRSLMRRHDAVIGGAAVLKMFCPRFSVVDHYDLHIPLRAFDDFLEHLLQVENYALVDDITVASTPLDLNHPCSHPPLLYRSAIARLAILQHGARVVHIVASGSDKTSDCPTLPIGFAWSTLFYNYVSADAVCCAYPSLTFVGRGLWHFERVLHPSFPEGTNPVELNKYGELGFDLQRWADEWDADSTGTVRDCMRSWYCPLLPRSFTDHGSFRLILGPKKTTQLDIRWVLGGSPCPDVCDHTTPVLPVVHSPQCTLP